jgi:membrane protein DedA with SNARE-associated domain
MFFLVDWINWVAGLFAGDPFLLVFVLGLVGNILPFVPTPSLIFIVALVISPGSPFQGVGLIEIASIAALGACIGKLASYALGYGARRAIGKTERFDSLRKYLGGSTFLVGLIFAATPLVDTAYIPLGMMRYSLPKTIVSLYTGKFVWILSVLFFSRQLGASITQSFGETTYATLLSIALLVPIAYLLISVDWEHRILGRNDTLRSKIITKIRNLFQKDGASNASPVTG